MALKQPPCRVQLGRAASSLVGEHEAKAGHGSPAVNSRFNPVAPHLRLPPSDSYLSLQHGGSEGGGRPPDEQGSLAWHHSVFEYSRLHP